jgi:hypothetical protein
MTLSYLPEPLKHSNSHSKFEKPPNPMIYRAKARPVRLSKFLFDSKKSMHLQKIGALNNSYRYYVFQC